jgi:hypothetical protein
MLTREMERKLMIFGDDNSDWNYTEELTELDYLENYQDDERMEG